MIETAIIVATKAHAFQTSKTGEPYIFHPLAVMMSLFAEGADDDTLCAAVLHDTVEDTDVSFEMLLREGFNKSVVDAVDSLTRREGEPYDQFIDRAKINPIGSRVKVADLKHNLSRNAQLAKVDPKKADRLRNRYREALRQLGEDPRTLMQYWF